MAEARNSLGDEKTDALEALYDQFQEMGYVISWGTGFTRGSFGIKAPNICSRSFLSIISNGNMALNFGWLNGNDLAERARDRFAQLIKDKLGTKLPDDYITKFLSIPMTEWAPKTAGILEVLKQLLAEFQEDVK